MNTKFIAIIIGVAVLGVVGVLLANILSGPQAGGTELRTSDEPVPITRPAVEAREDTFTIMTPEQKAEQERLAAEAARAAAQASSSATSTDETAGEDTTQEESVDGAGTIAN